MSKFQSVGKCTYLPLGAGAPGGAHQVVMEQGRNYHIARNTKHGAPQIQIFVVT
jgi:hypothetical protein